jgi:hypothetical protein
LHFDALRCCLLTFALTSRWSLPFSVPPAIIFYFLWNVLCCPGYRKTCICYTSIFALCQLLFDQLIPSSLIHLQSCSVNAVIKCHISQNIGCPQSSTLTALIHCCVVLQNLFDCLPHTPFSLLSCCIHCTLIYSATAFFCTLMSYEWLAPF